MAVANAALATRLPSALVTEAGVSSIFARGEDPEDRPLLVSDDLGLANLARGFGVEAVNTQAVLQELRSVGELTDEEYSSLIARLALLNYRFLQVEGADIVRLLEASDFLADEGTRALLSTLEGPECTPESAVSVVAGLIVALALIPLPEHQEPLLVSVLLGHLRHGRGRQPCWRIALGNSDLGSNLPHWPRLESTRS